MVTTEIFQNKLLIIGLLLTCLACVKLWSNITFIYRELSSTFARLCHLVDENLTDMQADIAQMEAELRSLDQVASAAKVLRNKANYLAGELDRFDKDYLTADQC